MGETGGGFTAINGRLVYLGGAKLQEELGVKDSMEEMSKYLQAAAS